MLTASADVPSAESLFNITETQIGLMGSMAVLSILLFLPISMFCRWRRALLCFGVIVNIAPVPLRYFAAEQQSFPILMAAMIMQAFGFGVLAVWPALIAAYFFTEERWAVVIAIAGLSNYIGGALGALFTPIWTGNTSEGLASVLKMQAFLSVPLFVLSASFFWIPAMQAEAEAVSLKDEARACSKPTARAEILSFGTLVGVSIALQCSNPMMLQDSGFTTNQAGVGNCVYQLAAAVVGIGIGGMVTQRQQLKSVIRQLHFVSFLSAGLLLVVCAITEDSHRSPVLVAAMIAVQMLLGASVMGILPFATTQLVYTAHPASENCITGLLNVVAMGLSTVLNFVMPAIGGVQSATLIFAIVLAETLFFAAMQRKGSQTEDTSDNAKQAQS